MTVGSFAVALGEPLSPRPQEQVEQNQGMHAAGPNQPVFFHLRPNTLVTVSPASERETAQLPVSKQTSGETARCPPGPPREKELVVRCSAQTFD